MNLIDLDDTIRSHMTAEIHHDTNSADRSLYLSGRLSESGRRDYPRLLLEAAASGTPESLRAELDKPGRLNTYEQNFKRVPVTAAATLAEGEFNRFYIRAVCLRAIEDGSNKVRAYRTKMVSVPRLESERLVGKEFDAACLLEDVREKGINNALGVPAGPNSGLSVCLIS